MATYVNNLRLKEIATGDESGTWGTSTNANLELIADALGYDTQDGFATDANATTTVADGSADPARALYFKVTSSATLTATRTLTIGPNTVSRVMFIENATTGSQSIEISQGSGSTVTIANGSSKLLYLDGAGATAAVVDISTTLSLASAPGTFTDLTATGTVNFTGATVSNLGTVTTADINGGTVDGVTIGASSAGAGTFSSVVATTADINGGTLDDVTVGGTTAGAGTFTNLTASGTINFSGATVSNLGTVTTANIDGGTVDGVIIGSSSPAAGTFTTLTDQEGGLRTVPEAGSKTTSYTLATSDVGQYVEIGSAWAGGAITIPDATFSTGDIISIFNNTTAGITLTCSISTAYLAGQDANKSSLTLATRGVATILFISGTTCVVSGNVA